MRTTLRYIGGKWKTHAAPSVASLAFDPPKMPPWDVVFRQLRGFLGSPVNDPDIPDFGFDVEAVRLAVRHHMREYRQAPPLETMKPFGFTGTGSGVDKSVYLAPKFKWVVKVPHWAKAWKVALAERELYNSLNAFQRQFLPRSYWLDRFTLVQEKFDTDWVRIDNDPFLKTTIAYIANSLGVSDTHAGNIGFQGSRWALIDFSPRFSALESPIALAAVNKAESRKTAIQWAR